MIDVNTIQVRRALEQLTNEASWKTTRWQPQKDSWEIRNARPPPRRQKRDRCLAGDCDRKPVTFGRYAGYCEMHAERLANSGTVEALEDHR